MGESDLAEVTVARDKLDSPIDVETGRRYRIRLAPLAWIAIALAEDEEPRPDEPYELKRSDGEVVEGALDGDGKARHEKIPQGTCRVRFSKCDVFLPGDPGQGEEADEEGWLDIETDKEHVFAALRPFLFSL